MSLSSILGAALQEGNFAYRQRQQEVEAQQRWEAEQERLRRAQEAQERYQTGSLDISRDRLGLAEQQQQWGQGMDVIGLGQQMPGGMELGPEAASQLHPLQQAIAPGGRIDPSLQTQTAQRGLDLMPQDLEHQRQLAREDVDYDHTLNLEFLGEQQRGRMAELQAQLDAGRYAGRPVAEDDLPIDTAAVDYILAAPTEAEATKRAKEHEEAKVWGRIGKPTMGTDLEQLTKMARLQIQENVAQLVEAWRLNQAGGAPQVHPYTNQFIEQALGNQ